jgi:hypothetical protein
MSFTRASYSKQSIQSERINAASAVTGSTAKSPIGLRRKLGSAISIIIGLTLCYAGLHYVPTLMRPTHVVDEVMSPSGKSALDRDRNRLQRFGIYAQSFLLRRTYLRANQGVTVHYTLPAGATMDLNIKQCRRSFVIEVFHCTLVSEQTIRIENKTKGRRALKFAEPGFYNFDGTVTLAQPDESYKIVWVRS